LLELLLLNQSSSRSTNPREVNKIKPPATKNATSYVPKVSYSLPAKTRIGTILWKN